MADLHKKLAMRRKGISGLKENESQQNTTAIKTGSTNIMDSISSMIPAPPPKPDSNHSDDDDHDSDWD